MGKKISKSGLHRSLISIIIIPVLLLVIVITAFSSNQFAKVLNQEVRNGLKDTEKIIENMYDKLYPGEYKLVEAGEGFNLMKGEHRINGNYEIIDEIKEQTGLDITLFYQDTGIITTIRDTDGERIVGSAANAHVIKEVLEEGTANFYSRVKINGKQYFAYYAPIRYSSGSIAGMLFVGKPTEEVNRMKRGTIFPNIIVTAICMLFVSLLVISYSNKMILAIELLQKFIKKVSKGNLKAELSRNVLQRNDELGEMGKYVIDMQKSLRELIEQDALTQLNNRRYGDMKLKQIVDKAKISGEKFAVAIGDIDFFKKVNDSYGHEGGDVVLKQVAMILKKHMTGSGFVARWGGEEFLMVFEHEDAASAAERLEGILAELRKTCIQYEDNEIKVTMTFGVAEGIVNTDRNESDELIKAADGRLYQGKQGGRDRVIVD